MRIRSSLICCFSFLVLVCFTYGSFTHGEILIIQSSDQHSHYERLPHFLGSIEVLSREFKNKYPDGKVILLINGDFSSKDNKFTEHDRGNFGYKILSQLAEKYLTIFTFGNHDAMDWDDSRLFIDQMNTLKKGGVHLVVSNVYFYPKYKNLFKDYIDIYLPTGGLVRIIGFTLPYIKQAKLRKFNSGGGVKVISQVTHIFNKLLPFLEDASTQPKIQSLIISSHIGSAKLKKIISNFGIGNNIFTQKFNLAFSGHDHTPLLARFKGIHIVNSGSFFNLSTVFLSKNGKVVSKFIFDEKEQKQIFWKMNKNSLEASLIEKTNEFIKETSLLHKKKINNIAQKNTSFKGKKGAKYYRNKRFLGRNSKKFLRNRELDRCHRTFNSQM